MKQANWTEKWLALPAYLGRTPEIPEAHYAWSALSEACHHRGYDIGLTEAELRAHASAAEGFRRLVAASLKAAAVKAAAASAG